MDLHFSQPPSGIEWSDWHWQLAHAARDFSTVARYLGVPEDMFSADASTAERYPLLVTPYYLSLAHSPEASDPILRQCLPTQAETNQQKQLGGHPDALAEEANSPVPRLFHRYPDRVVFNTGNLCAVHCRHCLRKRDWEKCLPPPTDADMDAICKYLSAHSEIREVLISGGDPLMLPEECLQNIVERLSAVPSIEMLRFGSRVPCVLPQRVTPRLAAILASGKPAWLATHFNHPWELTKETAQATQILHRAGLSLVNQSVLLKGVNDDADTLAKLFTGLLKIHIKPYYLFHGDPIQGTMHFRTGLQKGLDIMNRLRGRISGMALPAFAFDLPGGAGKIRLQPEQLAEYDANGNPVFTSWDGKRVPYPD